MYKRTENGQSEIIEARAALDEVNHAMTDGEHEVREMYSQRGRHRIEYTDGRVVMLVEAAEEEPRRPTGLKTHTGMVHAAGSYDKFIRGCKPRCCASRSALARLHFMYETAESITCKRCLNILAKEGV